MSVLRHVAVAADIVATAVVVVVVIAVGHDVVVTIGPIFRTMF